MRGRLIFPFLASIAQLDTAATAADPDGAGPLTSGYDKDFREPVRLPPTSGGGPGTSARREKTPIQLPAQIEVGTFDKLRMFFNGNSPDARIALIFHYRDLESAGMVDANGFATLRVGDRLAGIYDRDGNLVQAMSQGLFVVEAQPGSFGLGRSRNILIAYFESRDQGTIS